MKKPNLRKFIGDAIIDLVEHNVDISLQNKKKVVLYDTDIDPCEAFFSDDPLLLRVGVNKPVETWGKFLVHEYCHFLQTLEPNLVMKRFNNVRDGSDANTIISHWLKGKQINQKIIDKSINAVRNMEIDCEKRSVKLIRQRKLEIDIKKYIKEANAYVMFYTVMGKERRWYDTYPGKIKAIRDIMPDHFLKDYSEVPDEYHQLVKRHCFKK